MLISASILLFLSFISPVSAQSQYNYIIEDDNFHKAYQNAMANELLTECFQKKLGHFASALGQKQFLCRRMPWYRPDFYTKVDLNYRLFFVHQTPVLKLNIDLEYRGRVQERERVLNKVKEQRSCVQRFFASQGVYLDLNIRIGPRGILPLENRVVVLLNRNRSSHRHWYLYSSEGGGELNNAQLCGLMTHEIGHILGLDDTYEDDKRCPDRRHVTDPVEHFGLMNYQHSYIPMLEMANLEAFEIKSLLRPLCRL